MNSQGLFEGHVQVGTAKNYVSFDDLSGDVFPSFVSGDGKVKMWSLDSKSLPRSVAAKLNTNDWPNDAKVSVLADVLERSVHERFFMSPKACAGILRRANERGTKLPEKFAEALRNTVARHAA